MIPLSIPHICGNEWKYIKECLDSNWVSSAGSYVNLFEEKFGSYVGASHSIVTMNGTSALTLALQTLGIGPGDEVIVPSLTFIATVNPVKYTGAEPVFVDIDPDTWVMDPQKVEELVTDRTKAIIPVHLYGNVVDMEPLKEIADRHGLYIIEDATEALGSEYATSDGIWHKAGTIGHFGAYSFNGNKLITTGAGGMLVTNDLELGKKAKHLSAQAKITLENGAFTHDETGFNYRMPNILAAMGVAQLENIESCVDKKKLIAQIYDRELEDISLLQLQREKTNVKSSSWLYSLLINARDSRGRDRIINALKQAGIESRPFFVPINTMKPYRECKSGDLSVTSDVSSRGLNLPSSIGMTEDEVLTVVRSMKNIIN